MSDAAEQILAVLWPPARTGNDSFGTEIQVQFDAYYELEGALIDLKRTGADPVCIRTIERVQAAIAEVAKIVKR